MAEWLALVFFLGALIAGLYIAARTIGRFEARAKDAEHTAERARRRQQIDADVDRLDHDALDRELRDGR